MTTQLKVWQSHVWHDNQCFFVSTVRRTYDTYAGQVGGFETIVWLFDYDNQLRGEQIGHMGGVQAHQRICRCLISEGEMLDAENERHRRFFR